MKELTDQELVFLGRQGNTDAFACLIDRYQSLAERIALRLLQVPETSQDVVQEAFRLGLRAILCQKLLPRKGGGRTAALEIMINTPRIKKLILEGDTTKIPVAIQSSRTEGMQTFNQALVDLVHAGKVEEEEAFRCSPKPVERRMNLKGIYSGTTSLA